MSIELIAMATNTDSDSARIVGVATINGVPVVMRHDQYNGYFVYDRDNQLTEADVKAFANAMFPPTRCQHEYDCCGNFYLQYNSATFVDDDVEGDIWRIKSHYIQNI